VNICDVLLQASKLLILHFLITEHLVAVL
jgi:hypothetical protein